MLPLASGLPLGIERSRPAGWPRDGGADLRSAPRGASRPRRRMRDRPRLPGQRVAVGADRRVGRHVVDAVVGEAAVQQRIADIGRAGQPVQVVVSVVPGLGGDGAGEVFDAALGIARVGQVLQRRGARLREDRVQPAALRRIRIIGGDAVGEGEGERPQTPKCTGDR